MAPKINPASLWTPVDEPAANPASAWTPVNEAPPAPPVAVPQQGYFSSLADSSGLSTLGNAILHPIDTAKSIYNASLLPSAVNQNNPIVSGVNQQVTSTVDNAKQAAQFAKEKNYAGAISRGVSAIPVLGPTLDKATDQYANKNYAGEMGTLTGLTAATVAPKALEGVPGALKNVVRGAVDEPIVGSNVTPLARYSSAKRLGVNLDAADATNSTLLRGVKKVNENSLAGGHLYDNLGAKNTAALQGSTDSFLNGLYEGDRHSGGTAIQKALQANQQGLYSTASNGFESLPQDVPIPGLEEVGKTAQAIGRENAAYQNLFPSLKPSKAMNVVGDVSGLGPQAPPAPRMSPFVDEQGNPILSSVQPLGKKPASFGTGQQLRSDLLDFTRNNPDIVQNQGNGFIQRLAGMTDDALTNASSSLTPDQLKTFRDSNAAWKDMKATYDDPSSPFHHAARTKDPSLLYGGIGSKTAENAQNLLYRLSSPSDVQPSPIQASPAPSLYGGAAQPGSFGEARALANGGAGTQPSPAVGALRRGTIEGALKTNADGAPNFKTFGTQWNRIPADYRAELFSPDQNARLRDIANTANVLKTDFNPSGSAKVGQKVIEGTALLHPSTMAAPLLQYPVAKFMTSPKAVDWMMRPPAAPNPLVAPVASGALLSSQKRKGLYER